MSEVEVRRIFELYVDELVAESSSIEELLLVRLRYFNQDIEETVKRLGENPQLVLELVKHLSTRMQELDAEAGAAKHARNAVSKARSLALLLPETGIHGDPDPEKKSSEKKS